MTDPEFQSIFQKVVDEYDPDKKIYGPRRIKAIAESFRKWQKGDFEILIDKVFISERFAPMAKDLLRIADDIHEDRWKEKKRVEAEQRRRLLADAPINKPSMEKVNEIIGSLYPQLAERKVEN